MFVHELFQELVIQMKDIQEQEDGLLPVTADVKDCIEEAFDSRVDPQFNLMHNVINQLVGKVDQLTAIVVQGGEQQQQQTSITAAVITATPRAQALPLPAAPPLPPAKEDNTRKDGNSRKRTRQVSRSDVNALAEHQGLSVPILPSTKDCNSTHLEYST